MVRIRGQNTASKIITTITAAIAYQYRLSPKKFKATSLSTATHTLGIAAAARQHDAVIEGPVAGNWNHGAPSRTRTGDRQLRSPIWQPRRRLCPQAVTTITR